MEKLLSIVIPVYKVEKYIDKCISSLLVPDKQQLQLLDIVVINDGTPSQHLLRRVIIEPLSSHYRYINLSLTIFSPSILIRITFAS